MNILLIDNYDSFTFNLVQAIESLDATTKVKQNDNEIDLVELSPDKVIISPGPGTPKDAGNSNQIIEQLKGEIPILGVCLGHQCIGAVFNVDVQQSNRILHGKTSLIHHEHSDLFKDIPSPFQAARYHSLSLKSIPKGFKKTAWTNDGEIMGIQHDSLPLFGVQFHPESFLTPMGSKILENFLHGE
jgi:anthranilate synthase/aminodeoxychorismate synthase-like glutamine amidotransferase